MKAVGFTTSMRTFYTFLLVLAAVPAYAQRYDFGLHGGFSLYTDRTVTATAAGGTAEGKAGFSTGPAVGFTLGNSMYDLLGGEVRYTYLRNDLKITGSGQEVKFGGEAHTVHYDLLFHTSRIESRVRPYVAVGGGAKFYRGTGAENPFQPQSNLAILTRTSEVRPMISVGGGLKFAISERMFFRVDVHDFLTQIPTKVITPAPGASLSGWIHNFVPTAGIAFRF
jgi:hypothetical protein